MSKLSIKGLAVGLGVTWSVCMLFTGWAAIFGWCGKFVEVMASVYIGFRPTFIGGIIGGLWGFIDGIVGGALIVFIYNLVTRKNNLWCS